MAALCRSIPDIGGHRAGERLIAMAVHLIVRGKPVDAFDYPRCRERSQRLAGALMNARETQKIPPGIETELTR